MVMMVVVSTPQHPICIIIPIIVSPTTRSRERFLLLHSVTFTFHRFEGEFFQFKGYIRVTSKSQANPRRRRRLSMKIRRASKSPFVHLPYNVSTTFFASVQIRRPHFFSDQKCTQSSCKKGEQRGKKTPMIYQTAEKIYIQKVQWCLPCVSCLCLSHDPRRQNKSVFRLPFYSFMAPRAIFLERDFSCLVSFRPKEGEKNVAPKMLDGCTKNSTTSNKGAFENKVAQSYVFKPKRRKE